MNLKGVFLSNNVSNVEGYFLWGINLEEHIIFTFIFFFQMSLGRKRNRNRLYCISASASHLLRLGFHSHKQYFPLPCSWAMTSYFYFAFSGGINPAYHRPPLRHINRQHLLKSRESEKQDMGLWGLEWRLSSTDKAPMTGVAEAKGFG